MSNKKIFMSVTASAVIATSLIATDSVDANLSSQKEVQAPWTVSFKHDLKVKNIDAKEVLKKRVSEAKTKAPKSHTVVSGDTLSEIAYKNNISTADLMKWNNLDTSLIFPGQEFVLHDGTADKVDTGEEVLEIVEVFDEVEEEEVLVADAEIEVEPEPEIEAEVEEDDRTQDVVEEAPVIEDEPVVESTESDDVDVEEEVDSEDAEDTNEEEETDQEVTNDEVQEEVAPEPVVKDQPKVEKEEPKTEEPKVEEPKVEMVAAQSTKQNDAESATAEKKQEEADRAAAEKKKQEEADRVAAEKKKQEEADRAAAEKKKQEEADRAAAEKKKQEEADRAAAEKKKQEEADRAAAEKKKEEAAKPAPAPAPSGDLISTAKSVMGTPYVWGGSAPGGFDCSGFIAWAHKESGNNIGRTSVDGYYNKSYIVNNPQVGDLVFFENTYKSGISHMGIYLGGGEFIHAGSSTGVAITSVNNSYWSQHFHSYKRFY